MESCSNLFYQNVQYIYYYHHYIFTYTNQTAGIGECGLRCTLTSNCDFFVFKNGYCYKGNFASYGQTLVDGSFSHPEPIWVRNSIDFKKWVDDWTVPASHSGCGNVGKHYISAGWSLTTSKNRYTNNMNCYWTFYNPDPSISLKLRFRNIWGYTNVSF